MFHVVDDLPDLRDVLCQIIASKGYKAMQFDSAESYLEYFNSAGYVAPTAILSDYLMGGQTGLQLIKKVREKAPHQRVVIVSGTPCADLDAKIDSHLCFSLAKPYRMEQLFSLLDALTNCEKNYSPNSENPDRVDCRYGLEHECPFYPCNPAIA
jgi:two-component system response regulator FixJ